MDLYIDTASLSEIKEAASLGVLDGVTTNPSLIAKESAPQVDQLCARKRLARKICEIVKEPGLGRGVISTDYSGMMREARRSTGRSHRTSVIKLPITVDGLKACKALSDSGVKTNLTLCFQPLQALMVAKAGAFLVSPFIGRLDDIAEDGTELIQKIRQIYDNYGYQTKILAASIRHPKHLVECALAGCDVATVPYSVIKQMLQHPLTEPAGSRGSSKIYKKVTGG